MNLNSLYASYHTLSAATDISEHVKEYQDAIDSAKGDDKEKRLAAQILCKYFKHFPSLQQQAINAILALCEDDESNIRICAFKTLAPIFKENTYYSSQIADTSAQLLQVIDPQEFNTASATLLEILKHQPAVVMKAIFTIINDKTTNSQLRERNMKFILGKVKLLEERDLENELVAGIKKTLNNCSGDEFVLLMEYLVSTKYAKTHPAQLELRDLVATKIEIEQDFVPIDKNESNNVDRLVTCVRYLIPYFSHKLDSAKFFKFYCEQVLPHWEEINGIPNGMQFLVLIAQQLAEMAPFCGVLATTKEIEAVFDKLKLYMPLPPEQMTDEMPHLNFTMVEALLYTFHRIARQHKDFIESDAARFKDFRSRLLYFSRGVQGCLKVLNMSDKEKIFSPSEKRMREMSPILLENIDHLIKDLFHKPPAYKYNVSLSFKKKDDKSLMKATLEQSGSKRHTPITYETNGTAKQIKTGKSVTENKLYLPPGGKFSQNIYNSDRGKIKSRGGLSRGMRGKSRGGYRK